MRIIVNRYICYNTFEQGIDGLVFWPIVRQDDGTALTLDMVIRVNHNNKMIVVGYYYKGPRSLDDTGEKLLLQAALPTVMRELNNTLEGYSNERLRQARGH